MRPIRPDGETIGGVYVAASDVGGLFGDSYGLDSPGTTFDFAVNSGRIAAQHFIESNK